MKTSPVTPGTCDARSSRCRLARRADLSLNEAANWRCWRIWRPAACAASCTAATPTSQRGAGRVRAHRGYAGRAGRSRHLDPAVGGAGLRQDDGPGRGAAHSRFSHGDAAAHVLPTRTMAWRMACGASQTRWPSRPWHIKSAGYLAPATVARLIEEGRIVALKYAVVRRRCATTTCARCWTRSRRAGSSAASASGRPSRITGISACRASRPARSAWRREVPCACCGCWPRAADEADSVRQRYLGLEDCRDGISPIRAARCGDAGRRPTWGRCCPC